MLVRLPLGAQTRSRCSALSSAAVVVTLSTARGNWPLATGRMGIDPPVISSSLLSWSLARSSQRDRCDRIRGRPRAGERSARPSSPTSRRRALQRTQPSPALAVCSGVIGVLARPGTRRPISARRVLRLLIAPPPARFLPGQSPSAAGQSFFRILEIPWPRPTLLVRPQRAHPWPERIDSFHPVRAAARGVRRVHADAVAAGDRGRRRRVLRAPAVAARHHVPWGGRRSAASGSDVSGRAGRDPPTAAASAQRPFWTARSRSHAAASPTARRPGGPAVRRSVRRTHHAPNLSAAEVGRLAAEVVHDRGQHSRRVGI